MRSYSRLRFEALEGRALLSGSGFAAKSYTWAPPPSNNETAEYDDYQSKESSSASQGSIAPGEYYTATLGDPMSGVTGNASYQTTHSQQVDSAYFRVSINGAAANSSFSVMVDGAAVGQLTTDANGSGTLVLQTSGPGQTNSFGPTTPNPPPSVHAGSSISVGPANGTFTSDGTVKN